MAENKTSFVLYSDSKSIIDLLSNEQAGLLLKTLFAYVNDEDPVIDKSIALVFEMIKLQLKRDLKKWEKTKEGRSAAGKASAEARRLAKLNEQTPTNPTNVDFVQQTPTNPTNVDFVQQTPTNPTVSVSGNVSVSDFLLEKETKEVIDWDGLLKQFNLITNRKFKVVCEKTKRQFRARLKDGYSKGDILKAIKNCYADPFHIETNHKHLTLEFISRPDKMERYATDTVKGKTSNKKEIGML